MDSGPVARQSLADELAQRVRQMIQTGGYGPGDRLPSIVSMARTFGVAHPTMREALRKLETLGIVEIRHGSGVYAGIDHNALLIGNPAYTGGMNRKLLLDLVDARASIEVKTAELAATNATAADVERMRGHLAAAAREMDDASAVAEANRGFHREIARASGNPVLAQLLDALGAAFQEEQRIVGAHRAARERFHRQHLQILDAVGQRLPALAAERMRSHLHAVRETLIHDGPLDSENPTET